MASIRTLAIIGAGLLVGLTLNSAPTRAQSLFSSFFSGSDAPAQVTPQQKRVQHTSATRKQARRPPRRVVAHPVVRNPEARQPWRSPFGIGLLALLPWGQTTEMQTIRYQERVAESPVLSTADAWLGVTDRARETATDPVYDFVQQVPAEAATDGSPRTAAITVVDAGEFNDIDLAAAALEQPAAGTVPWLHALLAMFGGALAAISTARVLFA